MKPTAANLRGIQLLAGMNDRELARLIEYGGLVKREIHTNIVIEGEQSWGLFLLLQGMVGIFRTNKLTGMDYDIGQLDAGGFFGEMSLVDDQPRSATVKALTDCVLFYIPKDRFQMFLNESPDLRRRFYEACIKTLVLRLRELDDNYVVSQYQLWKVALRKEAA